MRTPRRLLFCTVRAMEAAAFSAPSSNKRSTLHVRVCAQIGEEEGREDASREDYSEGGRRSEAEE